MFEQRRVYAIDAKRVPDYGLDSPVYFVACAFDIKLWACALRQSFNRGRVVTFVRAANQLALESERANDLVALAMSEMIRCLSMLRSSRTGPNETEALHRFIVFLVVSASFQAVPGSRFAPSFASPLLSVQSGVSLAKDRYSFRHRVEN